MRVISINVNGLPSAREQGLLAWLAVNGADVICLQDIRLSEDEFEWSPLYDLPGYFRYAYQAERPESGGVGIYSRLQPKAVIRGLGFELADRYGRYLQADFDKLSIATLVLPAGNSPSDGLQDKHEFMEHFAAYLHKQRRKRREHIYCASLFVAHQKLDVAHWRECIQVPGFLEGERAWLDQLLNGLGYVDALREVNREPQQFTWWPAGPGPEQGWRVDYQLLTPALRRMVRCATQERLPCCEHAALIMEYDWSLSP